MQIPPPFNLFKWIEDTFERRKSPLNLWPEAKSAIVLGLNYGPESNPIENLKKLNLGNISVYALGDDYHKVVKGKLKQFSSKLITLFKEKKNIKIKVFVDRIIKQGKQLNNSSR